MTLAGNITIDPGEFHLRSVIVFKAEMEADEHFRDNPQKVAASAVYTRLDPVFNLEEKSCRLRFLIKLSALDNKERTVGLEAEYGIDFHFRVDNLEAFIIHEKDGKVKIDHLLGATLAGISYSTARGIILERTQGNYFEGVVLPVIDPGVLLEEHPGEIS